MNVTVILSLPLFVRNYLTTEVFKQIPGYTFDFIVEKKVLADSAVQKTKVIGSYEVTPSILKRQLNLFDVVTWRYRHLSKSFRFRIKRAYFYNVGKRSLLSFMKRIF